MESTNSLLNTMNNVTLDDEEEGGLAIEEEVIHGDEQLFSGFDAKLCVVARFISDGHVDFSAMQQTLASLWKPGMGVYIKDLDTNLFLFQFYHEVDVKRVMEGCPWSFNRRALVMARLNEGENPRAVVLNNMDLWVQVYDLKIGFMTERILMEIGNYVGQFVASSPTNFVGVWRDYLRVRVKIDVTKPLKRRMKIRKSGEDWFWVNFRYENVPTFCFIFGILGHSEKFCSRLFVTQEKDIVKPYGDFMRATFRRHVKPIGSKWLRSGMDNDKRNQDPHMKVVHIQGNGGGQDIQLSRTMSSPVIVRKEIVTIETKKRKTDGSSGLNATMALNTEVMMNADEEDLGYAEPGNNRVSKNGIKASAHASARLG